MLFTVSVNHLGSLLKCRFVTSGSERLHFYKLSGDTAAAGTWNHTLNSKILGRRFSAGAIKTAPTGNTWQSLETFLMVTTGNVLLASPM